MEFFNSHKAITLRTRCETSRANRWGEGGRFIETAGGELDHGFDLFDRGRRTEPDL
jgi:hypothetical protein